MELQSRKNLRLPDYDYSTNGAYFVTVCTKDWAKSLATIRRDDPCGRPIPNLSEPGKLAAEAFDAVEKIYDITFDYRVIMPDHIHFIVFLPERALEKRPVLLGRVVGAYKSIVSNGWLKVCKENDRQMGKIWQARYYDHVIRNEQDLMDTRSYIENNPVSWEEKWSKGAASK